MTTGASWAKARQCFEEFPTRFPAFGDTQQPTEATAEVQGATHIGNLPAATAPSVTRRLSAANAAAEETLVDIATVNCWLEGHPLSKRHREDADEDETEDEQPVLRQVRWVSHAEAFDPSLEAENAVMGAGGPGSMTRAKERLQENVDKVKAINTVRRASLSDVSSPSFLVGCIARFSRRALGSWSKNRHAWIATLEQELREWPGVDEGAAVKEVEVHTEGELNVIVSSLTPTGVVRDVGDHDTQIRPGDVLLVPDGGQDAEGIRAYVEDLKSRVRETLKLRFQPCMQVKDVKCVEEAPYVEHHQLFEGFNGGGWTHNVRTSSQFTSLESLVKELRISRQRLGGYHNHKKTPRRIRGLSARRSTIQAATRGCK